MRVTTRFALVLTLGLPLAACSTLGLGGGGKPGATASLADAAGVSKGSATLAQAGGDVTLAVTATGMAPGTYGIHVHTTGLCEGPKFTSAGGHWNPMGKQHGRDNPAGQHEGDLPNLVIGADGTGRLSATIKGAMLSGGTTPLLDADAAAVMIHAKADDYRTDPSGNSGDRIACGVVQPA